MDIYDNVFQGIISSILLIILITKSNNNSLGTDTSIDKILRTDTSIIHPASIRYSIPFSENLSKNTTDVIHPASINPANTSLIYQIIIYTLLILCVLFILWIFLMIYKKRN